MTRNGPHDPTPRISKPGEIWALLTLTGVDIPKVPGDDDSPRFTLNYAWKWDDEHGNAIFIEDWQIKDTGDSGQRFI
jgi:hypothetical protein